MLLFFLFEWQYPNLGFINLLVQVVFPQNLKGWLTLQLVAQQLCTFVPLFLKTSWVIACCPPALTFYLGMRCPPTFSELERMQRMKNGSAFPRVSSSLLSEVWNKSQTGVCQTLSLTERGDSPWNLSNLLKKSKLVITTSWSSKFLNHMWVKDNFLSVLRLLPLTSSPQILLSIHFFHTGLHFINLSGGLFHSLVNFGKKDEFL